MYTVKDANVAHSLMGQRLQPSNTALLLSEYFMVCKLFSDTATARQTHQRYITQIQKMRSIFTAQTLRSSEHDMYTDAEPPRGGAASAPSTAAPSPSALSRSSSTSAAMQRDGRGSSAGTSSNDRLSLPSDSTAARQLPSVSSSAAERGPQAAPSTITSQRDTSGAWHTSASERRRAPAPAFGRGVTAAAIATAPLENAAEASARSAASYTIFRREWGPDNYREQFHKPWNTFMLELSEVMIEVVTAWVSDLDEPTSYAPHLVRRSSTCCYDAAHGMCLLRWNTMREVRAYVDALHAVVNAPLSQFCVPLTLGMEVLGVPVLCMSLAPVSGPWQGWDTVGVVWHSFCGLCATLRLLRPLDRVEGGRGEAVMGLQPGRHLSTATPPGVSPAAMGGPTDRSGSPGNLLEEGSIGWSLLRQLEPQTGANDHYLGSASALGADGNVPSSHPAGGSGAQGQRRSSVFYGDPTSLTGAATGGYDRVGRQALAAAAAGRGDLFARNGGLQLTPAIGADARWYFIDARAICLYQWYARASWHAARVPRREMYLSDSGCVHRGMGPNKLILQSKLRIMVHQLLNGLIGGGSGTSATLVNMQRTSYLRGGAAAAAVALPAATAAADLSGGSASPRHWARTMPPILLSTLCHSHGVRYGTYVYAIVDLLRTEEHNLFQAVQAAYRNGSSSPNTQARLAQCRRCIQAVIGELMARATKHLIYQEWHTAVRQNPDWLNRFNDLCATATDAGARAAAAAAAAAEEERGSGVRSIPRPSTSSELGAAAAAAAAFEDGVPYEAAARRRLSAELEEAREELGAPLLDAVRRVVNGVFVVVAPGAGNGSAESGGAGNGSVTAPDSPAAGRSATEDASTMATTPTSPARPSVGSGGGLFSEGSSGYPVFNPALRCVAFRRDMFEELLLAVNEQYVVRPYSGGEKASEWQLLHKSAPVVSRRGHRTNTTGGLNVGSGGAAPLGGGGAGGGSNSGARSARGARDTSLLGTGGSPSAATRKRERSASVTRFYGAASVWYPAADEESIHVEPHELYPGWSLQCLQEMIGVPLVVRPTGVDVEEAFAGATMLRALTPAFMSKASEAPPAYGLRSDAHGAPRRRATPLTAGSPLRSAVWGTTLELPLCLRTGSVEGALEYAQQQRELGMTIVSAGQSSGAGNGAGGRGGVAAALWGERNPHMVYMGKLIQLHAADVRIACRGWPIAEDFDFLKQLDPMSDGVLSRAGASRQMARHRGWDSPLTERQRSKTGRGSGQLVGGGAAILSAAAAGEDTRTTICFNAAMHWRLCILNAQVDLHEAMSAMWHLTECIESTYGSNVVCGYVLRMKIGVLAIIARHFAATGVTTALEAAVADLDVLTGGLLNIAPPEAEMQLAIAARRQPRASVSRSRPLPPMPGSHHLFATPVAGAATAAATANVAAATPAIPTLASPPAFAISLALSSGAATPAQPASASGNAGGGGSSSATGATSSLVARLRSLPPPPPIAQSHAAAAAVAVAVAAAANRGTGDSTSGLAFYTNPLAAASPTRYGGHDDALETSQAVSGAEAGQLSPAAGVRKSYHLRSVQCVDLYAALLALLTRHMLLPDAHRTPHESLSRAVMFCSLRRELIVLTHGETSLEAAMAAGDVGLLLLQDPKTWEQAKAEFYRARRSILHHLRDVAGEGDDAADLRDADATVYVNGSVDRCGGANAEAMPGPTMSRSFSFVVQNSSGAGGGGGGGGASHGNANGDAASAVEMQTSSNIFSQRPTQPPPLPRLSHASAAMYTSSSDSAFVKGESRTTWAYISREAWATTPERLKQALCSVLNNIAYVFCRQAQRQYQLCRKAMQLFVQRARRHHCVQRSSTGLQLRQLLEKGAAKVEHLLDDAVATLQDVLQHASDVPVYDYAVALNNQACVMLFRHQYVAAKRLLLQSLDITTQLRSFSVARVALPVQLIGDSHTAGGAALSGDAGGEDWSVRDGVGSAASGLWRASSPPQPQQQQRSVSLSSSVSHAERGLRVSDVVATDPSVDSRGREARRGTVAGNADVQAPAATSPSAQASTLTGASSRPTRRAPLLDDASRGADTAGRRTSSTFGAPNAVAAIAAMLRSLGVLVDGDGRDALSSEDGVQAHDYYYTTGPSTWDADSPFSPRVAGVAAALAQQQRNGTPAAAACSSAEQLRACQVHTLRMLYRLEVEKAQLDGLRVRQLFSRYLATWRERRRLRRAQAAAVLFRVGVGAMTRVYLARRYRFSGYHWWLRQPLYFRAHLDPLLCPTALTTRRQLWDVWNEQVDASARLLQRFLRAAAVRQRVGVQYQFIEFYLRRCRPAVEEAVWQKRCALYTTIMVHQHIHLGLQQVARLREAVQTRQLWQLTMADRFTEQHHAGQIDLAIAELRAREALVRHFEERMARLRFGQLHSRQAKELCLLVVHSPRSSISFHGPAPLSASPEMAAATAVFAAAPSMSLGQLSPVQLPALRSPPGVPCHQDVAGDAGASAAGPARADAVAGGSAQHSPHGSPRLSVPVSVPRAAYTPPAVMSGAVLSPHLPSSPVDRDPRELPAQPAPPLQPLTPLSPSIGDAPTPPGFQGSRTRRARQVRIQADLADMEADAPPAAGAGRTAQEERYRLMQRQYREDERTKLAQMRRQRLSPGAEDALDRDGEGAGGSGGSDAAARRRRESEEKPAQAPLSPGSGGDLANAKWRQAVQRASEPRQSARGGASAAWEGAAAVAPLPSDSDAAAPAALLVPAQPGPNSEAPSPLRRSPSPPAHFGRPDTPVELPAPRVTTQAHAALTPSTSRGASPAASSSSSSRVAAAAAEAQRHQLLHASQLLLQFWWQRRAVPTYAATSLRLHSVFNMHWTELHGRWLAEGMAALRAEAVAASEAAARVALWQYEAVQRAGLLMLRLHGTRWSRGVERHTGWLRSSSLVEEERAARAVAAAAARPARPTSAPPAAVVTDEVAIPTSAAARRPPAEVMRHLQQWLAQSSGSGGGGNSAA